MVASAANESNARGGLKAAGTSYVAFALRHPEHFAAMFDAPLAGQKPEDGDEAEKQALDTLLKFVKGCQDEWSFPSGSTLEYALLAWTMVHGIAKLATTGRLPYRSSADILSFAQFVIDHSLPV